MVETRSRETIVEAVNDDYQTDDDCMMIIMIFNDNGDNNYP